MVSSQDPGASSETEHVGAHVHGMRRAGSTRAGAEEPVQEPDEFRRRYRNAIDTDMADIHDEEHSTPKKRAKKMMYNLGVARSMAKGFVASWIVTLATTGWGS